MYQLLPKGILRLADNASIPLDEANTDYAAYLAWLGEGNTPEPAYTPPPSSLLELKTAKNAEINAWRLAANRSTFTHGGKIIACDELSRSDIDAANGFITLYGALPPGWPGAWKAVDNSYIMLADVAAWKAFYASMFASGSANFTRSQALKASLAAAATGEDVEALVW